MKEIYLRKYAACLLFAAVASLGCNLGAIEPSEVSGKQIAVEYLGERTTQQLNSASKGFLEQEQPACFIPYKSPDVAYAGHKSAHQIGLNFTAATVSNAGQVDFIPPNLTGWVGEKQYILMSYQSIRSFNKCTGKPDNILNTDAGSFFGFSPDDVRIEYDRFAKRWYASAENVPLSTGLETDLFLVVSSDSVITKHTKWYFYRVSNAELIPQISPPGSGSVDYQQLAVDINAVYIVLDTFDSSGNFAGSTAVVFEKKSLLAGDPIVTIFPNLNPGFDPADYAGFSPPADNFDTDAKYGYILEAYTDEYPGLNFTQLYLYRILNPGSKTPSIVGPFTIDVPTYTPPQNAPHPGNVYGVNGYLQTGLFGALSAIHVRNGQLFACHPIQVDSSGTGSNTGDRIGVRWYQFDMSGDSTGHSHGKERPDTIPALVQYGTLFDGSQTTSNPQFYYTAAIMTNKRMDMIIEGTTSSNVNYTNVFYAGRKKSDPRGSLRSPVLVTNNTSNVYNFGPLVNPNDGDIGQRWGDESSLCPDPCNDLDIWLTGEWAAVENGWGIQAAQIKPLQ